MLYNTEALSLFWSSTERADSGCVEWTGRRNEKGYGKFYFNGKQYYAHRWIMRAYLGKDLGRWDIVRHKVCDNPPCVNTAHLCIGTVADNSKDMMDNGRGRGQFQRQTHCARGHELTDENTYVYPVTSSKAGSRYCRPCYRVADLARHHRTKGHK